MSNRNKYIAVGATVLLLSCLPFIGSRYALELVTQLMIYSLFALSLNVLVGYLGNISFGHAAFFAIGGYVCAVFQTTYELPLIVSLVSATLLTAMAALIIGFFCIRLNEIYFAMLTLAFSMLVWSVALKWKDVTGGDDGFVGVIVPVALSDPKAFFWFVLGVTGTATFFLWRICNSTMGRAFVAIRENETRAKFLGIDVQKIRLIAFVIAGAFAGLAGSLLALYNRGMYPETAFWTESGQVLIMVLLGGLHAFIGPILGAIGLYLLEVTINQYTEYWQIVLGAILLFIVIAAPEGLVGIFVSIQNRLTKSARNDA